MTTDEECEVGMCMRCTNLTMHRMPICPTCAAALESQPKAQRSDEEPPFGSCPRCGADKICAGDAYVCSASCAQPKAAQAPVDEHRVGLLATTLWRVLHHIGVIGDGGGTGPELLAAAETLLATPPAQQVEQQDAARRGPAWIRETLASFVSATRAGNFARCVELADMVDAARAQGEQEAPR